LAFTQNGIFHADLPAVNLRCETAAYILPSDHRIPCS